MREGPSEYTTIDEKIISAREKVRKEISDYFADFEDKESLERGINGTISKFKELHKNDLPFNIDEVAKGLKECINIKSKKEFIDCVMQTIDSIICLSCTQPEVYEKANREYGMNGDEGMVRLSEVLKAEFKENGRVDIHLATAKEFIKHYGIANFKKEIINGLYKLAEIIKSKEDIKEVWVVSWIVAKNQKLLENLGFTFLGLLSEEEKSINEIYEQRPEGKAFITKEDFLAKYGR